MQAQVRHERERQRFVLHIEGQDCVLDYRLLDGRMQITHTRVPPALAGRGLAAELTRHAFDTARAEGWVVEPLCSYAQAWLARHPDYARPAG